MKQQQLTYLDFAYGTCQTGQFLHKYSRKNLKLQDKAYNVFENMKLVKLGRINWGTVESSFKFI